MAQGRDVVGPGTKDEANDINLCFCDTFFILFHFFCCANKEKTPRSQWVRIKALPFPSMRSWPVTMGNHGSWDLVKCES